MEFTKEFLENVVLAQPSTFVFVILIVIIYDLDFKMSLRLFFHKRQIED